MLKLNTNELELRGLKDHLSKKGNLYYIMHCEDSYGEPFKFMVRNDVSIPQGLKKGDKIKLTLIYNSFKELVVTEILKAVE